MELKRHQRIEVQALERKWAKERAALPSDASERCGCGNS